MTDHISKEERSNVMRKVRSISRMEEEVSKALWNKGFRFRRNVRGLFGTPDIAIKKYKIVIFIDSCFWHACPEHGKVPKSNVDFWEKKLGKNKRRDQEVNQYYSNKGWRVKRVWEHELKKDFEGSVESLAAFIKRSKEGQID